jgi:hypothetical protein
VAAILSVPFGPLSLFRPPAWDAAGAVVAGFGAVIFASYVPGWRSPLLAVAATIVSAVLMPADRIYASAPALLLRALMIAGAVAGAAALGTRADPLARHPSLRTAAWIAMPVLTLLGMDGWQELTWVPPYQH